MDLRLKGKVVLVTGGAKGIGAAIVRGCCAEGAIPVIVDRDEQAGEQLQAELRTNRVETGLIIADLTDAEACASVVGGTIQKLGRLDARSEEHTSELQSRENLVCRLLLEKKKTKEHNLTPVV